jgi:hypothetical protein
MSFFFFVESEFELRASLLKAGTLPHLRPILLWLVWNGILRMICPSWPQTSILLISVFQVARIIGMGHWCPAAL